MIKKKKKKIGIDLIRPTHSTIQCRNMLFEEYIEGNQIKRWSSPNIYIKTRFP